MFPISVLISILLNKDTSTKRPDFLYSIVKELFRINNKKDEIYFIGLHRFFAEKDLAFMCHKISLFLFQPCGDWICRGYIFRQFYQRNRYALFCNKYKFSLSYNYFLLCWTNLSWVWMVVVPLCVLNFWMCIFLVKSFHEFWCEKESKVDEKNPKAI